MVTATKILLDVADAIKKLQKLKEQFEEVGESADELEDEGGGAAGFLDKLEGAAAGASPKLGKVASAARALTTTFGPLAAAGTAAAAGLAAVLANAVDLPEVLRDSRQEMQAFTDAVLRQLDIRNEISAAGDALINARTRRELRALRLEGGEITARQGAITAEKQASTERLKIFKDEIRAQEQLFKDSLKRRKDAQKILDEERDGVEAVRTDPRLTEGQRAIALAARAEEEAQKGNLELAQKFRDAAQEVTDELGGHVFFQNKVDDATQSIVDKAEDQVNTEKDIQKGLENSLEILQSKLEAEQEYFDQLTKETAELTKQAGLVTKITKQIKERRFQEQAQQGRDEAGRQVGAARQILNQELASGARSFFENLSDSFSQSILGLQSVRTQQQATGQVGQAFDAAEEIIRAIRDPDASAQSIADVVGPALDRLNANIGALETFAERLGEEGGGFRRDIEQLSNIREAGRLALRGSTLARQSDIDDTAPIREGARGIAVPLEQTKKRIEDLGGAAVNTKNRLDELSGKAPRAQTPTQQATAAVAPSPTAAPATVTAPVTQDIDVTVQIKGGMIDNETIDKVAERVQRVLRRGTGQSAARAPS